MSGQETSGGDDAGAIRSELRWFAAHRAAVAAHQECEILRAVIDQAESAWRLARSRLDAFEQLRDALDGHVNSICESQATAAAGSIRSAA